MKPLNDFAPAELDDLAAEARSFLNSKACEYVFAMLQAKYVQQLVQANVGDLTAASAHASMKVLQDVRNELDVFENEIKFRGKR